MRLLTICGGFVGFAIGISFAFAEGGPWPEGLWRASVAALVAAVLLRWWGRMWIKSLHSAYREQMNTKPVVREDPGRN